MFAVPSAPFLRLPIVVALSLFASGCSGDGGVTGPWVPGPAGDCAAVDPPTNLADHPCFEGSPPRPIDALFPYEVRSPLWSDGAEKSRYVFVPEGAELAVMDDGDLMLPPGGLLVKEFFQGGRRVETRLLQRGAATGATRGELLAVTYAWDEGGTVATLVSGGTAPTLEFAAWQVPTRSECVECHDAAAGGSLGVEVAQLQTTTVLPSGAEVDQLEALIGAGWLSDSVRALMVTPLADPAGDQPLDARVASYLHANCAGCHRPGGFAPVSLDLRHTSDLDSLCGNTIESSVVVPGDRLIVDPDEPERSVLLQRLASESFVFQMPPIGRDVVHGDAIDLVREWIANDACR